MRAAVFHEPGTPLTVENVDDPSPGAGQVVIAVKRCGICGTVLYATEEHDGLLVPGTLMGHEFAGEIVEVGQNCPTNWKPGRRVTGLPSHSCGNCLLCKTGKPMQCENNIILGLQRSGGAPREGRSQRSARRLGGISADNAPHHANRARY